MELEAAREAAIRREAESAATSASDDEPLDWLKAAAKADAEGLLHAIHEAGSLGQSNATIHWDGSPENHQAYVVFTFAYVNASVYTLIATLESGELTANHQTLTGYFDLKPFDIQRIVVLC